MYKIAKRVLAGSLCLKTLEYFKDNKSTLKRKYFKAKSGLLSRGHDDVEKSFDKSNNVDDIDGDKTTAYNFNETDGDKITVHNFIQGRLGNCGMVSSMSTLATNKHLYDKVVPAGQNFKKDILYHFYKLLGFESNVAFNLYKAGKLHRVEVDKNLPTGENGLTYCRSSNDNFVGPLLEKALVKLHFGGNYHLANGVPVTLVLSSLSNYFFEDFPAFSKNISRVIEHGLKTKSQMVVSVKETDAESHAYAVVGKTNENIVRVYDPYGEILSVDKNFLLESLSAFHICYFDNKIYGMPEIKSFVEITSNWPVFKKNNEIHYAHYDLHVEEDDTEVLVNVIAKHDDKVIKQIFVVDATDVVKSSSVVTNQTDIYYKKALRENLKRGKYKVVVVLGSWLRLKSSDQCRSYLRRGGEEFLFRLAASKQCRVVEKSTEEGREKIEGALDSWDYRILFKAIFSKQCFVKIYKSLIKSDLTWWL